MRGLALAGLLAAAVAAACLAGRQGLAPARQARAMAPAAPGAPVYAIPDRAAPARSWAAWAGLPPGPPCLAPEPPPEPIPAAQPAAPEPAGGWLDFVAAAGGIATGNPLVWSLAGQLGHLLYGVAARRRAPSKDTPS